MDQVTEFIKSSPIDVRTVVLREPPKSKLVFDPRPYLETEEYKTWEANLPLKLNDRNEDQVARLFGPLAYLKLVAPDDRVTEILGDRDKYIRIARGKLNDISFMHQISGNTEVLTRDVQELIQMKILFGEALRSASEYGALGVYLKSRIQLGVLPESLVSWTTAAAAFKMFYPEKPDQFLTDEMFSKLIFGLSSYRKVDLWFDFAQSAMLTRLLYPQRYKELGIDQQIFTQVRALYADKTISVSKFDTQYLYVLAALKILAAEDVTITQGQIKIKMQKPMTELPKPIPQMRRF